MTTFMSVHLLYSCCTYVETFGLELSSTLLFIFSSQCCDKKPNPGAKFRNLRTLVGRFEKSNCRTFGLHDNSQRQICNRAETQRVIFATKCPWKYKLTSRDRDYGESSLHYNQTATHYSHIEG